MGLTSLDNNIFLNFDDLTFVRFDEDPNLTAVLKFRHGAPETLHGEPACNLRQHLTQTRQKREERSEPELVQAEISSSFDPGERSRVRANEDHDVIHIPV